MLFYSILFHSIHSILFYFMILKFKKLFFNRCFIQFWPATNRSWGHGCSLFYHKIYFLFHSIPFFFPIQFFYHSSIESWRFASKILLTLDRKGVWPTNRYFTNTWPRYNSTVHFYSTVYIFAVYSVHFYSAQCTFLQCTMYIFTV